MDYTPKCFYGLIFSFPLSFLVENKSGATIKLHKQGRTRWWWFGKYKVREE